MPKMCVFGWMPKFSAPNFPFKTDPSGELREWEGGEVEGLHELLLVEVGGVLGVNDAVGFVPGWAANGRVGGAGGAVGGDRTT